MGIFKTVVSAASGLFVTIAAGVASAAPLDFEFMVIGSVADGSAVAMGVVRGLNEGPNAVDTVEVFTNSLGYGIGTYTHNDLSIGPANWTVTGGMITDWTFASFGARNTPPDVTDSTLVLVNAHPSTGGAPFIAITNAPNVARTDALTVLSFEAIPPAAIPLPATAGLLAFGLAGLGAMRARRRAG